MRGEYAPFKGASIHDVESRYAMAIAQVLDQDLGLPIFGQKKARIFRPGLSETF